MSFGPTATSVIQPYGQPCAYATETAVAAKQPRKSAPVALEINGEGVIQHADGLATRGMMMLGGPQTNLRQFTFIDNAGGGGGITLTPAQLVDGVLVIADGNGPNFTATLPSVTALNQFLNSRLITSEAAPNLAVTSSSPRTMFSFRVITTIPFNFSTPAGVPPGHTTSGYNVLVKTIGADATITNVPPTNLINIYAAASIATLPRANYEILFVQTAGPSSDPEWLICFANL